MKGWIQVPTETLKAARKRLGLSYEAVARQVPVGMSTYIRWEKMGRISADYFDQIADVLELDVTRPDPIHVLIAEPPDALPMLQALDRRLEALEWQIGEMQGLLQSLLTRSAPAGEDPEPGVPPRPLEFEAAADAAN